MRSLHKNVMAPNRRAFLKTAGASLAFSAVAGPAWAATPDVVSLERYQTAYRNQTDRGTCFAFATCAAMEAAYKRKYGLNLHLSEQYAFHINKAFELYGDYSTAKPAAHENNSSYWGFQGSSDLVGKLAVCAIPEAAAAPYLTGSQMTALKNVTPTCGALDGNSTQEQLDAFEFLERHIPTRARHAARYRIAAWAALPSPPSVAQIEEVLAGGHEVVAGIVVKGEGHVTLIIGYDRRKQQWLMKNSWGEGKPRTWPYSTQIVGAAYLTDVVPPNAEPQKTAWWIGRWHMNHDGWHGDLVIRRTIDFRHPHGPTKLGNYYAGGKRFDVNGEPIDDGQGLRFWIADTTDRVKPGEPRGQEFTVYAFSSDPFNAAGLTTWNGTPFGVALSRNPLAIRPYRGFDPNAWCADWSVSCDGARGTLSLQGIAPVAGSYRTEKGDTFPVRGSLDAAHPHLLDLQIAAPGGDRHLRLAYHSKESEVFSGIIAWKDRTLGVSGIRQAA
jgi:hypothetical protein